MDEYIWHAKWVWGRDGLGDVEPEIEVGGAHLFARKDPESQNLFYYFRHTFEYSSENDSAILRIAADSRYKLFLNGNYVGRGSVRCAPTYVPFDVYDLTSILKPGANTIAVLVGYYGLPMSWYLPGRGGLLAEVEIQELEGKHYITTDETWKVRKSNAWRQDAAHASVGFEEIFDAREEPVGWKEGGFDDSGWESATIVSANGKTQPPVEPWSNMLEREIPFMEETEIFPARVIAVGEVACAPAGATVAEQLNNEEMTEATDVRIDNIDAILDGTSEYARIETTGVGKAASFIVDFGRNVTGYLRIVAEGSPGAHIDAAVSESLESERKLIPAWTGAMAKRVTLSGRVDEWEAFNWNGFRYVHLTIRGGASVTNLRAVSVNQMNYPTGSRGEFECSDEVLTKLWSGGVQTLRLCMHDGYEDCPSREQRQWIGDGNVETLVNFAAFGDTRLVAKMCRDCARMQHEDGMTDMSCPCDLSLQDNNILDYNLHWIGIIWEYYQFTGDEVLVKELLPSVKRSLDWWEGRIDGDGLLVDDAPPCEELPRFFIDWSYIDRRGQVTAINCLYCGILGRVAQMAAIAGEVDMADSCRGAYERTRHAINEHLWDAGRGVYADCRDDGELSRRVSQHANGTALAFDIVPSERVASIIEYVFDESRLVPPIGSVGPLEPLDEENQVVIAQPFFMHFVIRGLVRAGRFDIAMRYFRERWGRMLDDEGGTLWEEWQTEGSYRHWKWLPRARTRCHAWSTTPTYDLSREVLGIRPSRPGYAEFEIAPIPLDVEWARGVFPSVKGDISISWKLAANEFFLEVAVPEGCAAVVILPDIGREVERAELDGGPVELLEGGIRIGRSGKHALRAVYK
ncbi:family 78 glycoside hydrolase catalytic domain [Candidatus Hydrogenedentota bacterium]